VKTAALDEGKSVLFEGAPGARCWTSTMETYPYVTSSSATSGGAGDGRRRARRRKSSTCLEFRKRIRREWVADRFPRRWPDLDAKEVRERGKRIWRGDGAARGAAVGWICRFLRYAKMINGIDSLCNHQTGRFLIRSGKFKCAWGNKYKGTAAEGNAGARGKNTSRSRPNYKMLPGWNETTYGPERRRKNSQKAAVDYLRFYFRFSAGRDWNDFDRNPKRDATIVPAGTLLGAGGCEESGLVTPTRSGAGPVTRELVGAGGIGCHTLPEMLIFERSTQEGNRTSWEEERTTPRTAVVSVVGWRWDWWLAQEVQNGPRISAI